MNKQQKAGCALLAVACVVFLFLGSFLAPLNGQICEKDEYSGQKYCTGHNVIYVTVWQVGKFFDDHGGGITAIATVLLGYITWQLAQLGREQANTTKAQLRAYLSISIGNAIAQNTAVGLRFQGDALLKNNGQTPAYKVSHIVRAAIIPESLVPSQSFFVPPPTVISSDSLGTAETRILSGVVAHLINDADIEKVKHRDGQSLWLWGIVSYEDIFKTTHTIRFCHQLYWIGEQVYGLHDPNWSGSD